MSRFAQEFKRLRESKQLTQRAVAGLIGVSQPSVAQYESGRAEPTPASLFAISDALGVPVEHWREFLTEPAPKPKRRK